MTFVAVLGPLPVGVDEDGLLARHRGSGASVTVFAERVAEPRGRVLVLAGADRRVVGVQTDPDPAEALSDLAACAVVVGPAAHDHVPAGGRADWGRDVLPALLEHGVAVYVDVLARSA